MGWFKSSVKPQQDQVFEIVNPLFGQAAPSEQQQQQKQDFQHGDASNANSVTQLDHPADVWEQHCAASASEATLRSPAGLWQSDSSGAQQMQQEGMPLSHMAATADGDSHSSNGASGRISSSGMRSHAPAPLLLPADEPSACAGAAGDKAGQGFADEDCYTPGTVGSSSPQGPLHVPAAHLRASAHAGLNPAAVSAQAAVSTAKAAHRFSIRTPMALNHAAGGADSEAQHAGQHSVIVLQSPESGSSSGNWSEFSTGATGNCSPATVSGVRLTASQSFSPAASLPATPTAGRLSHAGAAQQQQKAPSRPVSALQRQLQLQLQPQQQHSSTAAATADGDADEDDLMADLTACLGSLDFAAQLARTHSGMQPDKLPASIAAFRQSSAGGACSSRSNSGRYSSGGKFKADVESGALTQGTAVISPMSTSRSSTSESGAGVAAGAVGASCNSTNSSSSSSGGLISDGGRSMAATQQARGRSRLQTSTSNACLWELDQAVDDFDDSCSDEVSTYTHASIQQAVGNSNSGGLVLQKVGDGSKAIPLADTNKAPSSPCRSSSNRSSASSSSSREGSVHDGQRSNLGNSVDAPASGHNRIGPPRGMFSAAGAAAQPRPAWAPKSQQVNSQEEHERYQKALAVQQEQQHLQERRQHKQEQVVLSYSCLSPHSPHSPHRPRSDGGFITSSSSAVRSRPSSSKDTPPAAAAAGAAASEVCSSPSTSGGKRTTFGSSADPAPACGGNTAEACCAVIAAAPSSLDDAWAAIQARTGAPRATLVPPQPSSRPTSACIRPASASTGSSSCASAQNAHAPGSPMVFLGSGDSMPMSNATRGLRVSFSGAGALQAPLPPSHRPAFAGGSPASLRAKVPAAAAASIAAVGRVRQA